MNLNSCRRISDKKYCTLLKFNDVLFFFFIWIILLFLIFMLHESRYIYNLGQFSYIKDKKYLFYRKKHIYISWNDLSLHVWQIKIERKRTFFSYFCWTFIKNCKFFFQSFFSLFIKGEIWCRHETIHTMTTMP